MNTQWIVFTGTSESVVITAVPGAYLNETEIGLMLALINQVCKDNTHLSPDAMLQELKNREALPIWVTASLATNCWS